MTTTKIDDNIFHLFQHRPQVILRNIPMTRKMDRTPKRTTKMYLFDKTFSRTSHAKSRGLATAVSKSMAGKFHSQTTRLGPLATCAPLAVTSLQSPCVVQRQTSRPLLQQLLAAEDCETTATSRISVLRTPQPRQRVPCLQAITSLSAVIPNSSAPSVVTTGTPDVVVRRGIGGVDSDSCTYTW